MPIPLQRRRAGLLVAGLTAAVALAACLLLFRPLRPSAPDARRAYAPQVVVARLDQGDPGGVLRERANLYDPTPLFLPTEWNTNQRGLPATLQHQPGQIFKPFPPSFQFLDNELSLPVKSPVVVPRKPRDLLAEPSHSPFLAFGRQDIEIPPLPERPGFVEVREAGTGRIVPGLAISLEPGLKLPGDERNWRPAEFLVAITNAGMLGGPVNTASSDVEELDAFFRDYLARNLHLGERLPPGIYRVVVGP